MHRFVSLAALMVAISAPAYAFEIKGNAGIGQLQSGSQGVSTSGGIGAIVGVGHQDAASAGTAGAQLQIKPSGVTVLTQHTTATSTNQAALGLNGGFSFAGSQSGAAGQWAGIGGALKF
jgi:hypothetical protein